MGSERGNKLKKKIAIIDYGAGNILSLQKAISYIGYNSKITNSARELSKFDMFFLPGVGAFPRAISSLKKLNLINAIKKEVIKKKKILGICLGMQLLCNSSTEIKITKGLSIINGKVAKLKNAKNIRLPHIGFNTIKKNSESKLLKNIDPESYFYFNHSYAIKKISNGSHTFSEYSEKFISIFENENIFATQFHPEKSQLAGLDLIKNFIKV